MRLSDNQSDTTHVAYQVKRKRWHPKRPVASRSKINHIMFLPQYWDIVLRPNFGFYQYGFYKQEYIKKSKRDSSSIF